MTSERFERDVCNRLGQAARPRAHRGVVAVDRTSYGTSVRGTALEVLLPPSRVTPRLLVFAGIHGHEPDSTVVLSAAVRLIVPDALEAAVVLAANPDGLADGVRGNARGVELNRNWATSDWQAEPVGHRWADLPADARDVWLSPGTEPASEPETAALAALVERLRPEMVVSVHSPLACVDDPAATETGGWLSERTGLRRVGDVGYPTPGSFGTWAREQGVGCVTLELPSAGAKALVGRFALPLAELLAGVAGR